LSTIVAIFAGAAYYFLVHTKNNNKSKEVPKADEPISYNSVGLNDMMYLAAKLHPESSHMDVMWAVASTPETIEYALQAYNAAARTN
jgi:hypothetical protein